LYQIFPTKLHPLVFVVPTILKVFSSLLFVRINQDDEKMNRVSSSENQNNLQLLILGFEVIVVERVELRVSWAS